MAIQPKASPTKVTATVGAPGHGYASIQGSVSEDGEIIDLFSKAVKKYREQNPDGPFPGDFRLT